MTESQFIGLNVEETLKSHWERHVSKVKLDFKHFTLLILSSSSYSSYFHLHLHLCFAFHFLSEITHPEQPPALSKKQRYEMIVLFWLHHSSKVSVQREASVSLVFSLIVPGLCSSSDSNFNTPFSTFAQILPISL